MQKQSTFFVPGIGCSYLREFTSIDEQPEFLLRFLRYDEIWSWKVAEPSAIFLLEAGQAKWQIESKSIERPPKEFWQTLEFNQWLFLPAETKIAFKSKSHLLKIVVMGFSDDDKNQCLRDYELKASQIDLALSSAVKLSSTVWISELCHRIVYDRVISKQPDSFASRFCRRELIKEAYYKQSEKENLIDGRTVLRHHELSPTMQRALHFIEQKLHQPITQQQIADAAALSASSVSRMFQRELKTSPMKYVWERRLHDSRLLLLTGRYRVSDVAQLVGFSEVSSFSQAFTRMFGESPKALRASE